MNEILTVAEAAAYLHKHPDTIRRYIEAKKLPARKLSAGKNGIYAIARNDLLEYAVAVTIEKKRRQAPRKHGRPVASAQVQLPI